MNQSTRTKLQLVIRIICMALLIMMEGCATPTRDVNSRTGGLSFSFRMMNKEAGSAVLYTVSQDGTLGFGGGMDAHSGRTSWTGPMSDEQVEEFLALLDLHAWFHHKPESEGLPKGLIYRIELQGPQGLQRYSVTGQCESAKEVLSFLDDIANVRFDPILRQLPQPSAQD